MAKLSFLALGLVCAAAFLMPAVAAQTVIGMTGPISETITLPIDEWRAYRFTLRSSDSFAFSARVTQPAATNIDVYVLTESGFADYASPTATTFEYIVAGTRENTADFGATVSPRAGQYYFLVDNSNTSDNGARAAGPVTVAITAEVRGFPIAIAGGALLVFVAIVVAVVLIVRARRKKRRAAMPPLTQTPLQPPMQPPGPPPQGP